MKVKVNIALPFLFILSFFCLLCSMVQSLHALSSQDLVIVYNSAISDSKDVAGYYAAKRDIPVTNLIGVSVSESEKIDPADFDRYMVSAIRPVVKKLKKEGKNPAILLVYGIPLSIKNRYVSKADQNFKSLIESKLKEDTHLLLKLNLNIEELIHKESKEPKQASEHKNLESESVSTEALLAIADKSLVQISDFLNASDPNKNNPEGMNRVISHLIQLTGISSIAENIRKQLSIPTKKDFFLLKNDNLLKLENLLKTQLAECRFNGIPPENAIEIASLIRMLNGLIGELKFWSELQESYAEKMTSASVDSELALILRDSPQYEKWLPNPFLRTYNSLKDIEKIRDTTIMVGRLDGPTPNHAKRLVDDAIKVEETGLSGIFYIDARGLNGGKSGDLYSVYDEHLRNLYQLLKTKNAIKVILNNKPEVFSENACPEAALYCGWYSLANYVDSFQWKKGSVGFHIASAEARSLRGWWSNVWCKRMIEEGIAATLGPVEEPYLSSFPLPDLFFPLLMTGQFPLLEVYFHTTPYLSWRQICIGDPLYNPFKKNPVFDPKEIPHGNSIL